MRRGIIPFGVILCIGCADDSTGPARMPDLNGQWTYSATNVRAPGDSGGVTCNVSGLTLSITQAGDLLSGTYSGGTVRCSDGTSFPVARDGYSTLTGSLVWDSEWDDFALVGLILDQPYDWGHQGTVSGSSMGGRMSIYGPEFCDEWGCREELLASGDWMATRVK